MNRQPDEPARPFEQLLSELRNTVTRLEGAELTLDEAVSAYERCVELANACTVILDGAELRISQIQVEAPRLREQASIYTADAFAARRLLLGDDDDLADLLGDDES